MKVLHTLLDTSQGRIKYALKAWPLAVIPALLLSVVVNTLLPGLEEPPLDDVLASGPVAMIFLLVFLGPFLETLMMWPLIALLSRVIRGTWAIPMLSALVWAVLHSLQAPQWGFIIFWPFVVFSITFTEWRKKSTGDAILVTFLVHGLQNFTATVLTLL